MTGPAGLRQRTGMQGGALDTRSLEVSRTRKGRKPPGYEYWSRRPGNKCCGAVGPAAKRMTHKAERRIGRQQAGAGSGSA